MRPKKRFSQNFLKNTGIIKTIISSLKLSLNDNIIEIGPGKGALLKVLLEDFNFKSYTGIEIDRNLYGYLKINFNDERIKFINADFLKFSPLPVQNLKIIGNIPYNITTPIIVKLIKDYKFKTAVLTVQKEYAARLSSPPSEKDYSALTVTAQNCFAVEKIRDISKTNFYPVPKVDSSAVKLVPLKNKERNYFLLKNIKKIFSKRRKKLYNTLKKEFNLKEEDLNSFLKKLDINKSLRPENVNPADFLKLMKLIKERGVQNGN